MDPTELLPPPELAAANIAAWTSAWLARIQPPSDALGRITLWLDEHSERWKHEVRDVEQGLAQFLRPRAAVMAKWWTGWHQMDAANPEILDLARRLAERLKLDYEWVRPRLVSPPRAEGLRLMTPVQRALFYGLFVQHLLAQALYHRMQSARGGVIGLDEVVVTDLAYITRMNAHTGELLAVRLLSPLKEYTLPHLDTTLQLVLRALHQHGTVGVSLENVQEVWTALWVRCSSFIQHILFR
jgi:hypothetical protein